jgi:DNA-binding MarR family transcriptional regulator
MTDSDPESSLGYQVAHLARLLGRELRTRLEPFGVGAAQFAVLFELYHHDGLTQAELRTRLRVEQPTMANTLDRMERDGLVTRRSDPRDGRRSRVLLTQQAHDRRAHVTAAVDAGNAVALRGLDQVAVDRFRATLALMIGNLGRDE